jgi:hypothetical protein
VLFIVLLIQYSDFGCTNILQAVQMGGKVIWNQVVSSSPDDRATPFQRLCKCLRGFDNSGD